MTRPAPGPAVRLAVEPDPFPASPAEAPLTARVAVRTDVGRVRAQNEVRAAFLDLAASRIFEPPADGLVVSARGALALLVCDGMGGEAGGAIASALAAESILGALRARHAATPAQDDAALAEACVRSIHDASAHVRAVGRAEPRYARMGTTTTLAVLGPRALVCAQVGDSRAYLFRPGTRTLTRLTRDQTYLELLRAAGGSLPIDEEGLPVGANVILQAVGSTSVLDVVVSSTDVAAGDVLLLCSDGLHGPVEDAEIARVLEHHGARPGLACDELVAAALRAGAPDNVSCVVASLTAG